MNCCNSFVDVYLCFEDKFEIFYYLVISIEIYIGVTPNFSNELKLKIEPSEKLENITKIAVALASPASDTDMGPCGMCNSFLTVYLCTDCL